MHELGLFYGGRIILTKDIRKVEFSGAHPMPLKLTEHLGSKNLNIIGGICELMPFLSCRKEYTHQP